MAYLDAVARVYLTILCKIKQYNFASKLYDENIEEDSPLFINFDFSLHGLSCKWQILLDVQYNCIPQIHPVGSKYHKLRLHLKHLF